MSDDAIYATRKENLNRLALDKYRGNRAALARAADVHPNHINLVLSNNEAHRRNLGEVLARRIERQIGLPDGWLDVHREGPIGESPTAVRAPAIHESLSGAIKECGQLSSVMLSHELVTSLKGKITAPENLMAASADTNDVSPEISAGDTVVIDGAVKAIGADGIYIVSRAQSGVSMLRRFSRSLTGDTVISGGGESAAVPASTMKQLKVLGRIVLRIRIDRL